MNLIDPLSKLPVEDKLLRARWMRDEAFAANVDWLNTARKAYKFKAGDQWNDEEKIKLAAQGREPMVWNYVHSTVELAVGVLNQNPIRIYPVPTEENDAFLCDVLEDLVTWVDENENDAEMEHQTAFEDMVTTGKGFITVDVGPKPSNPAEVEIRETSLEIHEVSVDPACRRDDLSDARYLVYEKWMTAEDFRVRYPDFKNKVEEIFAMSGNAPTDRVNSYAYLDSSIDTDCSTGYNTDYYDRDRQRALVCHLEYKENYTRYYVTTEEGNVEISKEEKKQYLKDGFSVAEVGDVRVKWMHFVHDFILWEGESPVYTEGFSVVPMCAYPDKSCNRLHYYGLVKLMIDPQRECNKRWMQSIRLLARQGVGIMAETDAFKDIRQAQMTWSDPDAITFLNKNALKMGKVQEKSTLDFPMASMKMEEASKEALKLITGINPDLLGQAAPRQEPGIVVKLRQKQGMTILSRLFRNYKRTLKATYKRKLHIISKFMPDEQIVKILGGNDKYSFQDGHIIDNETKMTAPIRKVRELQYNLRVEDAPGNLSKQMSELATFMEMMQSGFPTDPKVVIQKMDLSPREKMDWIKFIDSSQQQQQQAQAAEAQTAQATAQLEMQKLQLEAQTAQANTQLEMQKLQANTQLKQQQLAMDNAKAQADIEFRQAQFQLKSMETQNKTLKTKGDLAAKAANLIEIRRANEQDYQIALAELDQADQEAVLQRMERMAQWKEDAPPATKGEV